MLLVATAFCMFGLRYVSVSIFQILRGAVFIFNIYWSYNLTCWIGGAIIFVAILKQFVLGHKLKKYQWIGVGWNVVAIALVGVTALLTGDSSPSPEAGSSEVKYDDPMLGVMLILFGALVQSLQYAFEEKVMTMEIPASPLLLIGMEGLWWVDQLHHFITSGAWDTASLEGRYSLRSTE